MLCNPRALPAASRRSGLSPFLAHRPQVLQLSPQMHFDPQFRPSGLAAATSYFSMPNIKRISLLPNESELDSALVEMEANDVVSIKSLRKRSKYTPLRNMISGLWFSILYHAVHNRSNKDEEVRSLIACLRAAGEISYHHNNPSKIISKRLRSGRASWTVFSKEPGLLAIFSFSSPPSSKEIDELQSSLKDDHLCYPARRYGIVARRILIFMEKILRKTEALYEYLKVAIANVYDRIKYKIHDRTNDIAVSNTCEISLEVTFNQSTYPRYTVQYDSPIFICVQSGDIEGTRALLLQGYASIYDVDPYSLGLLYYASYYCWRSSGAAEALQMCTMLIELGADMSLTDEIGNAPIHTMTDSAMAEICGEFKATALIKVGILCSKTSQELMEEHISAYKLTTLHMTLLGINQNQSSLRDYLQTCEKQELLNSIDKPDSRGRSPLAWAVEYGMADGVRALLSFGADPCQYRCSSRSNFPLLHLVIAGPPPPPMSRFFEVVKILLSTDIDINATDDDGWTAWHVAASWRSYDIMREMMRTHLEVQLDAWTNDGASAPQLSQDIDFYKKLMPHWYE